MVLLILCELFKTRAEVLISDKARIASILNDF